MQEVLKLILENSIKEENYFYHFYLELSEKADNQELKKELKKLAEYEKIHEEKLKTLDFNKLRGKIIPENFENLKDVKEELNIPPIEQFKDMKALIEFALKQEIQAKMLYADLAKSIDDPEAKGLLELLSSEEELHENILKERLTKL